MPRLALLAVLAPATAAATDYRPEPYVLLQVWGTAFDQDVDLQADPATYGDPEADPGVGIARARVGMFLDEPDVPLHYALVVGGGAPYDTFDDRTVRVGLIDAFVGHRQSIGTSRLDLVAGIQKVPFSRAFLESASRLVFQERAVNAAWLSPQREVGVLADLSTELGLRARAGVFNGNGELFGDTDPGVLGALRVEFATSDDTYQSWPGEDTNAFGVGVSTVYNHEPATRTLGLAGDVMARFGPVSVIGEVDFRMLRPGGGAGGEPEVHDPTTQRGFSAQVSYWIPLEERGVEIAVRGAALDDQAGFADNGDVLVLHGGATLRDLWPGVDVGAVYVHREELGGRRFPNDTVRLYAGLRHPAKDSHPAADR